MKMKLSTSVLGTMLLTLACSVSTNVAMANSHNMQKHKAKMTFHNGQKKYSCPKGSIVKWQNHKAYCFRGHGGQSNNNHHKKIKTCRSGYKMFTNGHKTKCLRKGGNGWKPQRHKGLQQHVKNPVFKKVVWKSHGGKKVAVCASGHKPFQRGKEVRCYRKSINGWKPYRVVNHQGQNSGHNIKNKKYDQHRFFDGKNVRCRKGNYWVDNGFTAHCGG